MSNPRGKQVASDIRGAWVRVVRRMEEEGKPLSEWLYEEFTKSPLETLKAIARFVPKEMMLQGDTEDPDVTEIKLVVVEPDGTERTPGLTAAE